MENILKNVLRKILILWIAPLISRFTDRSRQKSLRFARKCRVPTKRSLEIIPSFAWVPPAMFTIMFETSPWTRDWLQRFLKMTKASFFSFIRGFQQKSAVGSSYARLLHALSGTHANPFINCDSWSCWLIKKMSGIKMEMPFISWDRDCEITLFLWNE